MLQLLLAQLVVPPTQRGPIRLPQTGTTQGEVLVDDTSNIKTRIEIGEEEKRIINSNIKEDDKPYVIEGLSIYSAVKTDKLLNKCKRFQHIDSHKRALFCLNLVQNELKREGYITTVVTLEKRKDQTIFHVKEGRIAQVVIRGEESSLRLRKRIEDKTKFILGEILHIPTLQRNLRLLKLEAGVNSVDAKLSLLKEKPELAKLEITITEGDEPWRGRISLSNSGNNGSGELSFNSSFLKKNAIVNGDMFFLFGESSGTPNPKLGGLNGSLSYTLPISERLYLTASAGYNKKKFIELSKAENGLSNVQIQASGQLEWIIKEDLTQRHSLFINLVNSKSNLYLRKKSLPKEFFPDIVREPMSGYLKYGLNSTVIHNQTSLNGSVFLINGIAAMTPKAQRQELNKISIDAGQAKAIGGLISVNWVVAQNLKLKILSGGQWAFNNLSPIMQFSLGSDIGLRGLPSQLTSGDSGWLTTLETPFTIWRNKKSFLEFVPFFGGGGVYTTIAKGHKNDDVGTAGIFLRWMDGAQWIVELGWVDSIETKDNQGSWQQWSLADGLYAQASFRF